MEKDKTVKYENGGETLTDTEVRLRVLEDAVYELLNSLLLREGVSLNAAETAVYAIDAAKERRGNV